MPVSAKSIMSEMEALSNSRDAEFLQRFFKTGPGEYGEGDKFRGIRVPVTRTVVRKHRDVPLDVAVELLKSEFHEDRLVAVLLMVQLYHRGDDKVKAATHKAYLAGAKQINNWDLVDSSAEFVVGEHLETRSRKQIYRLAASENLWERRIAVLATFHFIKQKDFDDTFAIAEILMNDREDLIHKAVGWMIREVANRDGEAARRFIRKHQRKMPRTMLRYAIEKFPATERQAYLKGTA